MEIDKTDSHIFTATTTTTRMNISLETGKLRDTHSEGKVTRADSKAGEKRSRK